MKNPGAISASFKTSITSTQTLATNDNTYRVLQAVTVTSRYSTATLPLLFRTVSETRRDPQCGVLYAGVGWSGGSRFLRRCHCCYKSEACEPDRVRVCKKNCGSVITPASNGIGVSAKIE